jgi:hypothetical protein
MKSFIFFLLLIANACGFLHFPFVKRRLLLTSSPFAAQFQKHESNQDQSRPRLVHDILLSPSKKNFTRKEDLQFELQQNRQYIGIKDLRVMCDQAISFGSSCNNAKDWKMIERLMDCFLSLQLLSLSDFIAFGYLFEKLSMHQLLATDQIRKTKLLQNFFRLPVHTLGVRRLSEIISIFDKLGITRNDFQSNPELKNYFFQEMKTIFTAAITENKLNPKSIFMTFHYLVKMSWEWKDIPQDVQQTLLYLYAHSLSQFSNQFFAKLFRTFTFFKLRWEDLVISKNFLASLPTSTEEIKLSEIQERVSSSEPVSEDQEKEIDRQNPILQNEKKFFYQNNSSLQTRLLHELHSRLPYLTPDDLYFTLAYSDCPWYKDYPLRQKVFATARKLLMFSTNNNHHYNKNGNNSSSSSQNYAFCEEDQLKGKMFISLIYNMDYRQLLRFETLTANKKEFIREALMKYAYTFEFKDFMNVLYQ